MRLCNAGAVQLLIVTLATLAACGGDEAAPTSGSTAAGRVGVVLGTANNPELRQLEGSVRKALEQRDQELVVQSANDDPARQAQLVRTFASQGARAIVVAPLDSASLRPVLDAAAQRRIPVFTLALPVRGARVTTHMETDYTAVGVAAAEYIGAFLGPRLRAAVVGNVGAHGTREMESAFRARMTSVAGRVVSGTGDGEGTREGAAAATRALLARDRNLDAIFAMDPASAMGAVDAAEAARRTDLVIVAFGSNPEVLQAIGGTSPLHAAIVPRLDEGARLLAEAIVTELEGEPVTPSIRVPVRLVAGDSARR